MKAKITQKSELLPTLQQSFTFDILTDDDEVLVSSQSVTCNPSNATVEIKQKIQAFEQEYEQSQSIEVGTEIS